MILLLPFLHCIKIPQYCSPCTSHNTQTTYRRSEPNNRPSTHNQSLTIGLPISNTATAKYSNPLPIPRNLFPIAPIVPATMPFHTLLIFSFFLFYFSPLFAQSPLPSASPSPIPPATPICSRTSENFEVPSDFICQFLVRFSRQSDCSAQITETFTFPHTTGETGFRVIPVLEDLQDISEVSATRNGQALEIIESSNGKNERRVQFNTESSRDPVIFVLKYTLSNAVMTFSRSCNGLDEEPNGERNIMRWRSGNDWNQEFDELELVFETENNDATLQVIGEDKAADGSTATKQIVRRNNVDGNVEIYVAEEGVALCRQELQCFPGGLGVVIGLSLAGAAVLVAIIAGVVAICCTRRLKNKHEEEGGVGGS